MNSTTTKSPSLFLTVTSSGVVFMALAALFYSSFNSEIFRDFIVGYVTIAWDFCYSTVNGLTDGVRISPLVEYVLVASLYWLEWVFLAAIEQDKSPKTLGVIVSLQKAVIWLAMIVAVPHLYATSMPVLASIVLIVHLCISCPLIDENSKKVKKLLTDQEERSKTPSTRSNIQDI